MPSDRDTCRMPNCEEDPRGGGGYAGKFCSDRCEVRYDHLRDDARDAQRSVERESRADLPERDHPARGF